MQLYNDTYGRLKVTEPIAQGGESTCRGVVGKPGLIVLIPHPDKVPPHYEWWAEHVTECLSWMGGVVKCYGTVSPVPNAPAIGTLWSRAPGKMLYQNMPRWRLARVRYAMRTVKLLKKVLSRGLIYSDLKADNIFRDWWNRPTLIDLLSASSACDLQFPDGTIGPRQYTGGTREFAAPELRAPGSPWVNTEVTLAHSALVLVWVILKDDFPSDLLNQYGVKVSQGEIESGNYFGRFARCPTYMKPLDNGVKYDSIPELMRWVFEAGFCQGRAVPSARPTLDQIYEALSLWNMKLTAKIYLGVFAAVASILVLAALMFGHGTKGTPTTVGPVSPARDVAPVMTAPPAAPVKNEEPKEPDDGRPPLWRREK